MIYHFFQAADRLRQASRMRYYKSILDIHPSAHFGDVTFDKQNISIGAKSYIRSGDIAASEESCVRIGNYCAIGSNVTIRARTHSLSAPTASESLPVNLRDHGDIEIGDHVWIGNNVVIRHGVKIQDHAIIGANSVVTKDVPENAIFAGVPARLIRDNSSLDRTHY